MHLTYMININALVKSPANICGTPQVVRWLNKHLVCLKMRSAAFYECINIGKEFQLPSGCDNNLAHLEANGGFLHDRKPKTRF